MKQCCGTCKHWEKIVRGSGGIGRCLIVAGCPVLDSTDATGEVYDYEGEYCKLYEAKEKE